MIVLIQIGRDIRPGQPVSKYNEEIKSVSPLKRERYEMPDFIRRALAESGFMNAYLERPPYQQNDYIGWINRAKRPETREKRLQQMLHELKTGGIYMKMKHNASRRE